MLVEAVTSDHAAVDENVTYGDAVETESGVVFDTVHLMDEGVIFDEVLLVQGADGLVIGGLLSADGGISEPSEDKADGGDDEPMILQRDPTLPRPGMGENLPKGKAGIRQMPKLGTAGEDGIPNWEPGDPWVGNTFEGILVTQSDGEHYWIPPGSNILIVTLVVDGKTIVYIGGFVRPPMDLPDVA